MADPLLVVDDLNVTFRSRAGEVAAVRDLSFELQAGETLAVMGESGSGKSVASQALMDLVPRPEGEVTATSLRFDGRELTTSTRSERRHLAGNDMAMVFQDPLAALNPVFPVGWQIGEVLRVHRRASRRRAFDAAVGLMDRVGVPEPRTRARQFPHQFSGGMRQRVMIAMALACEPKLLIADEPTTALDVTVQAQIMDLLRTVRDDTGMALMLITHDLGVAAELADQVLVMYAGRAVEASSADSFYARPRHPYSTGLMASVPLLRGPTERLVPVVGAPPSLMNLPPGCAFAERCTHVVDRCTAERPFLGPVGQPGPGNTRHLVACHRAEELLEPAADG